MLGEYCGERTQGSAYPRPMACATKPHQPPPTQPCSATCRQRKPEDGEGRLLPACINPQFICRAAMGKGARPWSQPLQGMEDKRPPSQNTLSVLKLCFAPSRTAGMSARFILHLPTPAWQRIQPQLLSLDVSDPEGLAPGWA